MTRAPPAEAKVATEENIRIGKYDTEQLRRRIPHWDQLSHAARIRVLDEVDPVHEGEVSNLTCVGLHEYLATVLTLDSSDGSQIDPPEEIAFGDDNSGFSVSDTQLNNEVGSRISITSRSASGGAFSVDELLPTGAQNGNTLTELGVFSRDGRLFQHAPTDREYQKDSSFALLISITIPFTDA